MTADMIVNNKDLNSVCNKRSVNIAKNNILAVRKGEEKQNFTTKALTRDKGGWTIKKEKRKRRREKRKPYLCDINFGDYGF